MSDVHPATVAQASPLLVTMDGSSAQVPAVALNATAYAVGDRVAVVGYGPRLLVLGKAS